MRTKILIIGSIIFLCTIRSYGQEWIRIYGDSINTWVNHVFECYDKGYLLTGERYGEGFTAYGWLMKTDINGYLRWEKTIGLPEKLTRYSSSKATPDGGVITAGGTNILSSSCSDPLLVKMNVCGEKEWCKAYNAQGCNGWSYDIEALEEGYIALFDHWTSNEEKTIWLFRLNSEGDVIWGQVYATNPEFWSEWSHSLLRTNDSCFVITGEAYYPDSTYPTKKIIKIILIKVTSDGEAIFEVPWGTDNGIYSDGRLSVVDSKNNIYTAGRRARKEAPYGDSPTLFKISMTGEPVFYKDLKSASSLGIASTINWFQDSTLVLCSYWGSQVGIDTTGLIKTDSLGNLIKEKPLLENYGTGSFFGSDITFNNRILLAGSIHTDGVFNACAFKLTSDLEYDSVYTTPFTYDSLCPHAITSDTIPLDDCEVVIVGIDDPVQNPEKTRLKVYPNPAGSMVTVEMPEYLVRTADGGRQTGDGGRGTADGRQRTADSGRQMAGTGITATTYYHQWKSVRLDVFDLFGKLMYTAEIPKQTPTTELDISAWPAGMYVARIVFMNDVVGVVKFIKE